MRRIAEDANGAGHDTVERKPWMDLQVWLERAEHRVLIPFAWDLVELIEPEAVRLRRDFKAVLGLIMAHAICHQVHRERDQHGRIIATLEDYDAVYEVVVDAVSEGIGKTVSETVRETVAAVDLLLAAHPDGVPLGALSEALKADKSTASRLLGPPVTAAISSTSRTVAATPRATRSESLCPIPPRPSPSPKSWPSVTPPQHLQHRNTLARRNGSATPGATPSEDKSAGQGADSGTVAGVAGVSGGEPEVLHSTVAAPLHGDDRCALGAAPSPPDSRRTGVISSVESTSSRRPTASGSLENGPPKRVRHRDRRPPD